MKWIDVIKKKVYAWPKKEKKNPDNCTKYPTDENVVYFIYF